MHLGARKREPFSPLRHPPAHSNAAADFGSFTGSLWCIQSYSIGRRLLGLPIWSRAVILRMACPPPRPPPPTAAPPLMRSDLKDDPLFSRMVARYAHQEKTVRGLLAQLARADRYR
jgi:hypothetical protein